MSGVEALTGMEMQDTGWWNPSVHQGGEMLPSDPRPLAAMLKLGLYGFELRNHPLRRRHSPDGKRPHYS